MTPNTRKKRKIVTQRERRGKQTISDNRIKIANSLWKKRKNDSCVDESEHENNDDVNSSDEAFGSECEEIDDIDGVSNIECDDRLISDSDDINTTEPADENENVSRATVFRYRAVIQGCLSFNALDNLQILIGYLNIIKFPGPITMELKKIKFKNSTTNLNERQICYRVKKFRDAVHKAN